MSRRLPPRFVVGVEQDCGLRDRSRNWRRRARSPTPAAPMPGSLPSAASVSASSAAGRRWSPCRAIGLLELELEADRGAPLVEHLHVAERVGRRSCPARSNSLPAGADGATGGIDLERVEPARLLDGDRVSSPAGRWITISAVPPCRPVQNHGDLTSSQPVVPKTRTVLSCATMTLPETSARMSFGNCRTAEAHSSTPVAPRWATPATFTGSRNGFPATVPAISRAIETG